MAGIKLRHKVQASSIMEVVIAMVVIVTVFGMAMMIFSNVMRSSSSVQKIKAQAILRQAMYTAEKNKENLTKTYNLGDFSIEQKVSAYPGNPDLSVIELKAYDLNGQLKASLQKIIEN